MLLVREPSARTVSARWREELPVCSSTGGGSRAPDCSNPARAGARPHAARRKVADVDWPARIFRRSDSLKAAIEERSRVTFCGVGGVE